MPDERSNRIADLYERALTQPPDERQRFLRDARGDDEALRREVESLLEFESASEEFLERPATAILTESPTHQPSARRRRKPRQGQ